MKQKKKFIITDEGRVNLYSHVWDDRFFSDQLARDRRISSEKARDIGRFLKETIDQLSVQTITQTVIDEIFKMKVEDLGLSDISPIRLRKSFFIKNGLAI